MEVVICELFNGKIHGVDENSSQDIEGHYLVIDKIQPQELKTDRELYRFIKQRNLWYKRIPDNMLNHVVICNYKDIVRSKRHLCPEIAKCIDLPGNECVAILKTFWIRIIQRTWKKIYKQRQYVIKKRLHVQSLIHREKTGCWPVVCAHVPSLQGMLHNTNS